MTRPHHASLRRSGSILYHAVLEQLESRRLLAQSAWAFPASDGHLIYQTTSLGDRVMDFSTVGYQAGLAPIPNVPVRATVSPIDGDDTANIQAAINAVEAMPLDASGFRGAVLLNPGEYQIATNLLIDSSGVVLRGSGVNQTILRGTGTGQRTIVQVRGSGSRSTVANTTKNITDKYVPVGAISFNVSNTSNLAVGDQIVIHRPGSQAWIDALGMNLLDNPWSPGSYNIQLERTITRIEGNRITVDGPIEQALDLTYGQATINKFTYSGRINNVGVEYLGGISDFDPSITLTQSGQPYYADDDHPWTFIGVWTAQNGWVRNISATTFGYAAVYIQSNTKWFTVQDSQMIDPVSVITGGNRYPFNMDSSSHVLWRNLYTRRGRHDYVQGSLTQGPNVFVDSRADVAYADTGPHHRYSTGALWDNIDENGNAINIQNRHNSGTGHGWAGANQVIWNSEANSFIVQNPPTAYNWSIGGIGTVNSGNPGLGTQGIYDSHGTHVDTRSLYYAQLSERLKWENLVNREIRLGDHDNYVNDGSSDTVAVDAAWLTSVQNSISNQVSSFDALANDRVRPFTFTFTLLPGEHVVSASLNLGVKSSGGSTSSDRLYFEHPTRSYSYSDLGVTTPGTSAGARVIDLTRLLPTLQDGKLNVAILGSSAIDWAVLSIQTASTTQPTTTALTAAADAYVQDGTSAATNFGSATTLQTKNDTTNNNREAFLKFDLAPVGGYVTRATVRLVPTSVGYHATTSGTGIGAIFNQIAFVSSDSWTESGLTWNNKPASDPFFAEFISYPNAPLQFDVTSLVQAALAGDKSLSLRINSIIESSTGQISFASRENSNVQYRPQLIIQSNNGILPVADAYVQDGSSANTNFGSAVDLGAQKGSSGSNRETYLRFDTVGFTSPAAGATLRLMPYRVGGVINHIAQFVSADTWTETGLTWNNKPASSTALGSSLPSEYSPAKFDVTTVTNSAIAGDDLLSVRVFTDSAASSGPLVQYGSRESAQGMLHPLLVLKNMLPTITTIPSQQGSAGGSTAAIWFGVWDAETAAGSLTLSATSSNTALLPNANIAFGGSGMDRTFTLTPAAGQSGTTTITLTVTDAQGQSAQTSFQFNVINAVIINGDQQSAGQTDTFRVVRNGSLLEVYRNDMNNPVLQTALETAQQVVINGLGGADTLLMDLSGGDPVPAAGITFDGGAGPDVVSLLGSSGNDAVVLSAGSISAGVTPLSYLNSEQIALSLGAGQDVLTASGDASVTAASVTLNVLGGGLLSMTSGSTLPTFADVSVSGATFNLNGVSQTIDSLNGSGTILNNGGVSATLTVGQTGGDGAFSGTLANGSSSLALTKVGPGTLHLSGANSYTGVTMISGGVIESGNSASLAGLGGVVWFNGGTFHVTADTVAANVANKFATTFAGATASSTGTFNIDPGVTLTIGGTLASLRTNGGGAHGGPFTKAGLGTLRILSNNGQQDDPFNLQQGTIIIESATALGGGDSGVRLDMRSGTTLVLRQDAGTNFLTPVRATDAGGTINLVIDRRTPGAGLAHSLNALTSAGPFTLRVSAGSNITSGFGTLTLGSAALSGTGTFDAAGSDARVSVTGAVSGAFGLTKEGSGTLVLNGANSYTGQTLVNEGTFQVDGSIALDSAVTVAAAANLVIGATQTLGTLTIQDAGSAIVAPGADKVLTLQTLNVAINGQLDLADNNAIIDYTGASPLATIRAALASGFNAGAWNGPGIVSSAAAADGQFSIGYAEASSLGMSSFAGQPIDSTALLLKYTYGGDANLDGQVDIADLGRLATRWQTAAPWIDGDFTFNQFVDIADLGILATNWQNGVPGALASTPMPSLTSLQSPGTASPTSLARRRALPARIDVIS